MPNYERYVQIYLSGYSHYNEPYVRERLTHAENKIAAYKTTTNESYYIVMAHAEKEACTRLLQRAYITNDYTRYRQLSLTPEGAIA